MKAFIHLFWHCAALWAHLFFAQDGTEPSKGDKAEGRERPGRGMRQRAHRMREALREKFKDMTPEEREAAKAKAKEKMDEFRKKREEMKAKWEAMTPEEEKPPRPSSRPRPKRCAPSSRKSASA